MYGTLHVYHTWPASSLLEISVSSHTVSLEPGVRVDHDSGFGNPNFFYLTVLTVNILFKLYVNEWFRLHNFFMHLYGQRRSEICTHDVTWRTTRYYVLVHFEYYILVRLS